MSRSGGFGLSVSRGALQTKLRIVTMLQGGGGGGGWVLKISQISAA